MEKNAKAILTEMFFDLFMDREIDRDAHHISPGGYELNGKQFDFMTFEGKIDEKDRKLLHVNVYGPDLVSYEQAVEKEDLDGEFQEFFVYTGEYDEPEIRPVRIADLVFYWSDGTETKADDRLLKSANGALA